MKAICHREGLLSAVQLASAALPARDVAQPILKNIKAVADDGRCTLMATDRELGIRLDVRGLTVQEPGEALHAARVRRLLARWRGRSGAGHGARTVARRAARGPRRSPSC